jgi:nickel transport protein
MATNSTRIPSIAAATAVLLTCIASDAWAHGARCRRIDNALGIQAEYDNGNPMADAKVSLFHPDSDQTPWKNGSTDDEGRYFFVADADGEWTVQVEDNQGHAVAYSFQVTRGKAEQEEPAAEKKPSAMSFILALAVIFGLFGAFSLLRRR